MLQKSINVKYVNAPKGKGPASVKDDNGTYWKFWTKEIPLERFSQGQTYNIGYETEPYNGQDQYYIKAVMTQDVPAALAASMPLTNGHAAPQAKYTSTDTATAERIFVCGALNNAIAAGKVELEPSDLIATINMFRHAYRETFGK